MLAGVLFPAGHYLQKSADLLVHVSPVCLVAWPSHRGEHISQEVSSAAQPLHCQGPHHQSAASYPHLQEDRTGIRVFHHDLRFNGQYLNSTLYKLCFCRIQIMNLSEQVKY